MPTRTSTRTIRPGLRRAAVSVVALLALASGCANAEPSVVAYVGPTRISQGELDDAVAGVTSTLQEGQQVSKEAVVNVLIHGVLAEQIAAANNLTVTDSERETLLKGSELAGLLDVPAARPVAFDIADQQIVASKVGPEAYLKAVGEKSVTLNPRYGVLDPTQKLIVTDQSGSLAKPVPPTP
ncbi:MAG TPA: hypothetical protein VLJ88_13450 [Propionibacteriaceae bacterium]|nr:hypothetical protein [Propionibacteriaceae bacterium]